MQRYTLETVKASGLQAFLCQLLAKRLFMQPLRQLGFVHEHTCGSSLAFTHRTLDVQAAPHHTLLHALPYLLYDRRSPYANCMVAGIWVAPTPAASKPCNGPAEVAPDGDDDNGDASAGGRGVTCSGSISSVLPAVMPPPYLIAASAFRVNVKAGCSPHIQILFQATRPGWQRRGFGRLLVRLLMQRVGAACSDLPDQEMHRVSQSLRLPAEQPSTGVLRTFVHACKAMLH